MGAPPGNLAEIQRSRLLAGAVGALDELGYAHATVARITSRARVSRRTFYELFENREECFAAVLDDTAKRLGCELWEAGVGALPWRERMREGLWTILGFLEREPQLARVCVVHVLRGSGVVLERREAIVTQLTTLVDAGRGETPRGAQCTSLTAEGVVGAALAILYARLSRAPSSDERLTSLLGELMAIVVLPYQGAGVARREQSRLTPTLLPSEPQSSQASALPLADPLAEVQMRLTYRTAKVLQGIGEYPGASNRQVAAHAGIQDQGQISKLLARLERLGLLANQGEGHAKGEPNAWRLTPTGLRVTRSIAAHAGNAHATKAGQRDAA